MKNFVILGIAYISERMKMVMLIKEISKHLKLIRYFDDFFFIILW